MLIDTHAHLTDKAFSQDREEVLCNARKNDVEKIISSGYNLSSSIEELSFAKKHDNVFVSIGVYPAYAEEYDDKIEEELIKLAKDEKVVAIGEIGLQYTEGMPEKSVQKEVFVRQIKLANKLKLPIVIHCREAFGDLMQILNENKEYLTYGGTLHCFTGSKEIAKELIKLGFFISLGGVSTFKNATKLKETVKEIPLENIILETDCPYLTPHPYRSQKNQPSQILTIAENLALLKGEELSLVKEKTTQNARRLFNI